MIKIQRNFKDEQVNEFYSINEYSVQSIKQLLKL